MTARSDYWLLIALLAIVAISVLAILAGRYP